MDTGAGTEGGEAVAPTDGPSERHQLVHAGSQRLNRVHDFFEELLVLSQQ